MPFLPPNQQRQSTEGTVHILNRYTTEYAFTNTNNFTDTLLYAAYYTKDNMKVAVCLEVTV